MNIPNDLRMYVVVRTDIAIPYGKLAPQAGHAFANALLDAIAQTPDTAKAYLQTGRSVGGLLTHGQTKIALGGTLADLLRLAEELDAAGIPRCLVRDEGRTVFPEPTFTCIAFGPITPDQRPKRAKRLRLLPLEAPVENVAQMPQTDGM